MTKLRFSRFISLSFGGLSTLPKYNRKSRIK